MMSKKHFIQLAAIIARTEDMAERKRLCEEVGTVCAHVNKEFRWSTWRSAYGVSQ
ncbi:hypothetical protein [Bosea sp. MMO-172]|uniref:hypothetical protein n=1 Tax=Bosea sp. MMO-172 TaxID=3127885 RepID=UPI003019EBC4